MMTYCRSVWPGAHLASQFGARAKADLVMLATVIDHPYVGNMPSVGDILMQRFRPGQLANSHGWQVAGQLDLLNRADASMAPMQMREDALRDHRRKARFSEGLRKSKNSSGS